MNRAEHLQWAKDRALEILETGTTAEAYTSFLSDMGNHDETREHPMLTPGFQMLWSGMITSKDDMKKFINDFN